MIQKKFLDYYYENRLSDNLIIMVIMETLLFQ
jgi:hypothetical protein